MNEIELAKVLESIEENYTNYDYRYNLVLKALLLARDLKYECGFRFDASEPKWPVIVILLPNIGEISWHMPPCNIIYDDTINTSSERTKRYSLFVKNKQ